jgi:hypothetical protein
MSKTENCAGKAGAKLSQEDTYIFISEWLFTYWCIVKWTVKGFEYIITVIYQRRR